MTHLSTGRYRITFTVPFRSTPTMLVTRIYGSPDINAGTGVQPAENAIVDQITTTIAVVATGNADGVLTDSNFGFLAIGDVP